ncbi:L,D-transpeptidase [Streptomyces tauricus]|uniref:L,D-transpeptidase n=1 Tax=Streptomyces tauricus TaxID=68274 RepID=UPI002243F1CD|nr:Ig-like domain-containing protein [Streptomyces tauricus]MCW8103485.1 Ig-like domain-containing protein [Streptomyces tauricus]
MGVSHISDGPETWSRRGVLAVLGAVPAAVLTGCGSRAGASDTTGPGAGATAPTASADSAASTAEVSALTLTPADGSRNAGFTSPVQVTASSGTLSRVRVTADDGSALSGTFDDTRTTWTSDRNPYSGTAYTVTAEAEGATEETLSFSTEAAADTFVGRFTPEAGSTSGVGMPVSVTFTHAVTDRAAVEKAITVTADPRVEVVGHWFSDTRLDFRPEEYWAAGTKITLALRLRDVEGAAGVYGTQSKDVTFHIGREQISTVDLAKKTMTVRRDGRTLATYPVSGGDAEHTTWSGVMVISERFEKTRMESSTVGLGDEYDIDDVPHAQRLTTSGTFIHGNYWASSSIFGGSNTTHGCIGLRDAKGGGDTSEPGYAFYKSSMLGDVVVVKNSGEDTVDPANGFNGWNMSWSNWRAGSAF